MVVVVVGGGGGGVGGWGILNRCSFTPSNV